MPDLSSELDVNIISWLTLSQHYYFCINTLRQIIKTDMKSLFILALSVLFIVTSVFCEAKEKDLLKNENEFQEKNSFIGIFFTILSI